MINKVELQGIIGRVSTKVINGSEGARLSVATDTTLYDQTGQPIIEVCWHNVVAWRRIGEPNPGIVDFSQLEKGTRVHVLGRLRNRKYTTEDGEEKSILEVVATELSIPNPDDLP